MVVSVVFGMNSSVDFGGGVVLAWVPCVLRVCQIVNATWRKREKERETHTHTHIHTSRRRLIETGKVCSVRDALYSGKWRVKKGESHEEQNSAAE